MERDEHDGTTGPRGRPVSTPPSRALPGRCGPRNERVTSRRRSKQGRRRRRSRRASYGWVPFTRSWGDTDEARVASPAYTKRNVPVGLYVAVPVATPFELVTTLWASVHTVVPDHITWRVTGAPASAVLPAESVEVIVPLLTRGVLHEVAVGFVIATVAVPRTVWPSAWVTVTATSRLCAEEPAGHCTVVEAAVGVATVQLPAVQAYRRRACR